MQVRKRLFRRYLAMVFMAGVYAVAYSALFGLEYPKTVFLRKTNEAWKGKYEILNARIRSHAEDLEALATRDNGVYRTIFGMDELDQEIRLPEDSTLLLTVASGLRTLDEFVGERMQSYEDVGAVALKAGDMASCIPAVPPVMPGDKRIRPSSPFGYRIDPISGVVKLHEGFDFSCRKGTSVYATGDGTVSKVTFELKGYGNCVVIDHGFGYKTRYAHLQFAFVSEGMKIKRGECIGLSGNSGKSSGPHLHYEVIHRGIAVNPVNFFDLSMPKDEFLAMVNKAAADSPNHMTERRVRR